MKYLNGVITSSGAGSKAYAEGWDRIFGRGRIRCDSCDRLLDPSEVEHDPASGINLCKPGEGHRAVEAR